MNVQGCVSLGVTRLSNSLVYFQVLEAQALMAGRIMAAVHQLQSLEMLVQDPFSFHKITG